MYALSLFFLWRTWLMTFVTTLDGGSARRLRRPPPTNAGQLSPAGHGLDFLRSEKMRGLWSQHAGQNDKSVVPQDGM